MKKIYKIEKKKTEVIGAPPSDWPWFEGFDNIFSSIIKINGIPNAIDQGVYVMNSKIEVVNVNDEEDFQTPWMLSSHEKQTFVFGDDNANVRTTPFVNFDSPRTWACKLHSVQGKPNKKLKRKKRWLSIGSSTIVDAINNFTHVVKDIWKKKMEMKKFITSQMLQSEEEGK
jgi:hypothetical protein